MTEPVLFLTGGSRGIGAETVRLARLRGYKVAFTYLSDQKSAEALAQDTGALAIQADVRDIVVMSAALDATEIELGPISHLVNNAGIHGGLARLEELAEAQYDDVLDTNLKAGLFLTQQIVSRWRSASIKGSIVNLSSTVATFGGNRLVSYAASKAALETATIGLARELGPDGIRINCVAPGVIETDQLRAMPEERRQGQLATIPLGRFGTGHDVAKAILFLLSDEASYITGTTLTVHGGR